MAYYAPAQHGGSIQTLKIWVITLTTQIGKPTM